MLQFNLIRYDYQNNTFCVLHTFDNPLDAQMKKANLEYVSNHSSETFKYFIWIGDPSILSSTYGQQIP